MYRHEAEGKTPPCFALNEAMTHGGVATKAETP